jgi:hypothetical protein
MPTSAGPNISGEENLVFGYDLGDHINSYRGRPTVNQFPIVGTVGEGPEADNTALFPTRGTNFMKRLGYGQTFGGYTIKPSDAVYKFDAVTSYVCAYHGGVATIPVGAYVTFTFEYLVSSDVTVETGYLSNIENYGNGAFSTSPPSIDNSIERNIWHKVKYTAGPKTSTAGSQAMFLYPGGCSSTRFSSTPGYILYKNPMVEFNMDTIESQYVAGTRSATQGLLDLTGNSTIDLTNVSFDSNAQMTFDGTDDYLNVNTSLNSGNFTYETVMSVNDTTYPIFGAGYGTAGTTIQSYITSSGALINLYAPIGAGGWVYGSYSNLNGYVSVANRLRHIVVTNNNTVWQTYVDGYLVGNVTFYQPTTGTDVGIGRIAMQSPSNLSTVVKMVKLYNRVLTSTEVLNNYNNIKRKYGI